MTKPRQTKRSAGRPILGREKRVPITIRIDPDVLDILKADAAALGIGYQTHVHMLLFAATKGR